MPSETVATPVAPAEVEVAEVLTIPEIEGWELVDRSGDLDQPFVVILYNCDCHTFDDVIAQMQKATGCSLEKAGDIANEVHTKGRAIAFSGSLDDCERVAGILREIKLQVETDRSH